MSGRAPGILRTAQHDPSRLAIVCEDRRATFSELETLVSAVARCLEDAGVAPGDVIAVMLHNSVELFAVWNAVARMGGIVVPIGYRLTPSEAAYIIDDSEARALVYDDTAIHAFLPSMQDLAIAWHVDDDDLWSRAGEGWLETPYAESTVATMPYTSGTTGRPKGVRKRSSSAGSLYNSELFLQYWDFRRVTPIF